MDELTLEENIRQILPTLPLPIQKFFEQRKLGETARRLMERYALHIDRGTILEQELMLLLLGLKNPDEFTEDLYAQLPISKQTVLDIIADINKEVFIPLREEEMKSKENDTGRPSVQKPLATLSPQANDEKFLEDHEEPHFEINKIPFPPKKIVPPPANLPGVVVPPPAPHPSPKATEGTAKIPAPPAKPYSVDPYREPLDTN